MKRILVKTLKFVLFRLGEPQLNCCCQSGTTCSFVFTDWACEAVVWMRVKSSINHFKSAGCNRCCVKCSMDMYPIIASQSGLPKQINDPSCGDYIVEDPLLKPGAVRVEWRF